MSEHPPNHYEQCAGCGRYCLARREVGRLPNGTPIEAWCHAPWYATVPTRKRPVPVPGPQYSDATGRAAEVDGTVLTISEYATVCSLECAEWLFTKGELAGWQHAPMREETDRFSATRYFVGADVLAVLASLFAEAPPERPSHVWRMAR